MAVTDPEALESIKVKCDMELRNPGEIPEIKKREDNVGQESYKINSNNNSLVKKVIFK